MHIVSWPTSPPFHPQRVTGPRPVEMMFYYSQRNQHMSIPAMSHEQFENRAPKNEFFRIRDLIPDQAPRMYPLVLK